MQTHDMKPQKNVVFQLELTSKQQEEVRKLTGKQAETLLLTIEELEERIAPRLATN